MNISEARDIIAAATVVGPIARGLCDPIGLANNTRLRNEFPDALEVIAGDEGSSHLRIADGITEDCADALIGVAEWLANVPVIGDDEMFQDQLDRTADAVEAEAVRRGIAETRRAIDAAVADAWSADSDSIGDWRPCDGQAPWHEFRIHPFKIERILARLDGYAV